MDKQVLTEEVKKQIELFLEKQFSDGNFDALTEQLKVDLEVLIPGKVGNMVIEAIFPRIMPMVKEFLLAQIEKISDKV